jgi:protein-ribulosamine 3-kinase
MDQSSTESCAALAAALRLQLGAPVAARPQSRVTGGCSSAAWRWESALGPLFVKLLQAERAQEFVAEAAGLREIAATGTVRVPRVLAAGRTPAQAFLALEWLELTSGDARAALRLGEQLAALHRCAGEAFGWQQDNTIGSTAQINARAADWPAFYRDRRLRFQLELARERGAEAQLYETGLRLCECVPQFFAGYRPVASLVHGDLWGGNWAMTAAGEPVLFDPCPYYADREVDIAMTQLFGGFDSGMQRAYESAWPLAAGWEVRRDLYNLYHVLNHFNLFGGAYAQQARRMIAALLAEV